MFIRRILSSNLFYTSLQKSYTSIKNDTSRSYNVIINDDIPEVSPSIIKKALSVANITFEEGNTCFIVPCSVCCKSIKTAPKLYINSMTGNFSCTCGNLGQWKAFEQHFINKRKKKSTGSVEAFVDTGKLETCKNYLSHIEHNTTKLNSLSEENVIAVLKKFNLPNVPMSALSNLVLRIDSNQSKIYFPLENVESRTVGYRVLSDDNKVDIEPSNLCEGILVSKLFRQKDQAILVPSLPDFFALLNSKLSGYAVCLPNGYVNLPLHILPSLERFKKLILWFGDDLLSWESARNFAKKLGEKRCYFIRPAENQPMPHLAGELDLKVIVANAQPLWHKSITTFSSLREDVLSDLQNIDKVEGVKWKRFPTLNKILRGHRRGELTVLTGPTGSGKTTFVSEYSLDLAMQGVNTLWGSFEIRNSRLARIMLQQFSGLPLENHLEMFESYADSFEKLPIYYMTFHGQQTLKVVMEAVEHAQYVHDIAHVIIDNLQFMMGITEDQRHMDRFWKQDAIIASFRTFATRKNCHVTLIIHPRKERDDDDLTTNSIFGGAKASQEADNVLIIQDKRLVSMRGKKYLQVAKNRYSGDLGIMALEFDKAGLSYASKKKKKITEKSEIDDEEIRDQQPSLH